MILILWVTDDILILYVRWAISYPSYRVSNPSSTVTQRLSIHLNTGECLGFATWYIRSKYLKRKVFRSTNKDESMNKQIKEQYKIRYLIRPAVRAIRRGGLGLLDTHQERLLDQLFFLYNVNAIIAIKPGKTGGLLDPHSRSNRPFFLPVFIT